MTLPIYRLRRLLAAIAILLTLLIAGMYFYARSRATNALKTIPGKIGYDIKQTAQGFQFSKSDGKRTLFTVSASKVKEFKLNGNAELHNVSIVLYGRDSSRFDQIYGDDFAFNQKTGDVTANGDVQIDLIANPAGLESPDQSTPKELRNPIHLKTRDLVFNRDSGNAWTDARVELRTPQASGWAVGVKYAGKSNTLTLSSQIHIALSNPEAVIEAKHGVITNDPRQIVLEDAHLTRPDGSVQADEATFFLSRENHVERILATGNVRTETRSDEARSGSSESSELHGRADRAEFLLPGGEDLLRTATLSGNVHFEESGAQQIQGEAGRVIFDFAGQNQLQKVHAVDGAHLTQNAVGLVNPAEKAQQDLDLTAPVIDFTVAKGRILKQATTSGPAQITIAQLGSVGATASTPAPAQRTVVTAGKFVASFLNTYGKNHLASVQGAPDARIVNSIPGQPDRISSSDSVDATFLPQGGIDSIVQAGKVIYSDGQPPDKRLQAWANSGRYTPADHVLLLTGSPRVSSGGMATTADRIRLNRATGEAQAEGSVKSTYSELKEQPDGALLASSSPIHVTAQRMTSHNAPAAALYSGNARLWQDANVIEAPSIQFDRDHRSLTAQGTATTPVRTVLVQSQKARSDNGENRGRGGKGSSILTGSNPISITSAKLTYTDSERRARYEGGVVAKGADFTATSKTANAYLLPRSQTMEKQGLSAAGQLERMVAEGDVMIQQPSRRAEGQTLVYTAPDEKFVLTGGPPSIFDAEQGKITGVSLTFYRRDDRVLVEGEGSTPVVTTTRVAR